MKIIIAGAGEVGVHLARLLANQAQDIILIDRNKSRLKYAETHTDVIVARGDATSVSILEEVGIKNCDLLIAATDSEATNLTVAILG